MKMGGKQKTGFQIVIICLLLSCLGIIATIPLHEAVHWIISDIDPYSEPIEFNLFNGKSFQKGENILSSALGSVTIKESYPGSFKDRPQWIDSAQEFICVFLQILITFIIVTKILRFLFDKKQDIDSLGI